MLVNYLKYPKPPVCLAKQFMLKNATPRELSFGPAFLKTFWTQICSQDGLIEPPSANGTIAGGVLTLTFANTVKTKALGMRIILSAGDQTALSVMTFTITRVDSKGNNVVQTVSGTPTSRASGLYVLFAAISGDTSIPQIHDQGNIGSIAGLGDLSQTTVVAIAGPTGMEVSVELLNSKHPDVKALFEK